MLNLNSNLTKESMFKIISLALFLAFACYCVYYELDTRLKASLEESVALQGQTIAFGINKQFEEEFKKLESCAILAEKGEISFENLIELSLVKTSGESMGILTQDGELIVGTNIPGEVLQLFQNVFKGERTIKYRTDCGLIFAIPIKIDNQVCLLYDRFDDDLIRKKFSAISYNGAGVLIFINGDAYDEMMVLATNNEPTLGPTEMREGWDTLRKKYDKSAPHSASIYHDYNGKSYFLHATEVSSTYNIAISGYVPWKAVAVGIDYIYMVMFVNFVVVCLMLMFGVRYMIKKHEAEKLAKEKVLADSANQAKSEFLSNMSHEIRTPINAIMGMNEMVIRESRDQNILEYSENLQNAARTLLGLVNDILDFSKIEAGKMEIIPVEYHISSMLNDLVNMIKTRAEKKKLEFKIDVSKDIPSVLFGDEIRIKQIITNILTNAVKYTKEGSVTLNVTTQPIDDEKIYLCVSVKDTGIGIKKEDIKKLFSAFERIEEERNRTIEGTGLGMNITQKLLSLMNSHFVVESVYGKGSTFSFQVEQKIMNAEPIGDFQEDYKKSLNQHKEYHELFTAPDAEILVVDDTVMNLTVIKGLLKQTKIKIDTALNGPDCLTLAAKNKYDIIFLDHRMPGMDGIETLSAMKKIKNNINQSTPVISLTANALSGAKEKYLSVGFQDYLTKPINATALENLIKKYLSPEKIKPAEDNSEVQITDSELSLPEWLTKIEGLDTNEGVKHCGSVEAYIDALTVFAESITTAADSIEGYYKAEDWKNYTTKVHALKSTAKVIGAAELSEKARRLEDAGNSGYFNEINQDTEPLLKLYRSYLEKLSPLIQTNDNDEDKPLITDYDLNEAFEAMKEFAMSFDYDSMMFVIDSLKGYRLPEDKEKIYFKIKTALTNLDWEKINEILKNEI